MEGPDDSPENPVPVPSDESIIESLRAGNQYQAAALIFSEYADKLFVYALGLVGNPEIAGDVVGEVFLKVYLNLHAFDVEQYKSVRPWLYRITRNTVVDFWRKKKRIQVESLERLTGTGAAGELIDRYAQLALDAVVEEPGKLFVEIAFTEKERRILKLRLEGYKPKEIAELLQATGIDQVLSRIKAKIRAYINHHQGES